MLRFDPSQANFEGERTYETVGDIKQLIRETFPEESERAVAVALCESGVEQFRDDGEPVQGPTQDFGLFQIHIPTHGPRLEQLGLDVKHSIEDNIAYARLLYDSEGWQPWTASEHCWRQ